MVEKILSACNNRPVLDLMNTGFQELGIHPGRLLWAGTIPQAISLIHGKPPLGLVILDHFIDHQSGATLLGEIRKLYPSVPVIGTGLDHNPPARDYYSRLGVEAFLPDVFTLDQFSKFVSQYILR